MKIFNNFKVCVDNFCLRMLPNLVLMLIVIGHTKKKDLNQKENAYKKMRFITTKEKKLDCGFCFDTFSIFHLTSALLSFDLSSSNLGF